MRIFITGGAGFLGSHLCDHYVQEGHHVVCYDNLFSGDLNNVRHLFTNPKFKFVYGDVRDKDLLEKIMPRSDVVIHLAAQIHVDRSITETKLTYDVNVIGTQNVLEVSRMFDIDRVIFASSSEVYGSGETPKMSESHPLNAPHPYGASKIAADRMCYAYAKTYGMKINIVRLFNIYGPRQKDSGYGGVISVFTRRVASGQPPIVYGTGEQTRDYLYIKDAVRAYDLVLKSGANLAGTAINFGTGKEVTINHIAAEIIRLFGKQDTLKPAHVTGRPSEVERLCADITLAEKELGFKPQYSFDEGLKELVSWFQNYRSEEWTKER